MLLLLLLQSTVMLVFREEKNPEDEAKAWQFWHGRQHSVKQRILDAGRWSFACDYSWGLFRCCLRRLFLPFARADVSTGVTELLKVERFIKGWRLATTQGAAH